jgi:hypothetical protein
MTAHPWHIHGAAQRTPCAHSTLCHMRLAGLREAGIALGLVLLLPVLHETHVVRRGRRDLARVGLLLGLGLGLG